MKQCGGPSAAPRLDQVTQALSHVASMRLSCIRLVCVLGILAEVLTALTITGGSYPSNGRIVQGDMAGLG